MTLTVGQRIRVSDRPHEGHHRTPGYVKGLTGQVERLHGAFRNPETHAYGGDGLPTRELYMVALDYKGTRVYVDVFQQWLEAL